MIHKKLFEDDTTRAEYFHDLAEGSRALELLLNASYNFGMVVSKISINQGDKVYIVFSFDKKHLNVVGALMDLVPEIDSFEYNVKRDRDGYKIKLSCSNESSEELFIRTKEIMEDFIFEKKQNYNYKVMSSVYNIGKIVKEVIDADILFAVDKKIYDQGKCYLFIYKSKQILDVDVKKAATIEKVLDKLKKSVLRMPTVLFCTFEELRTFYFELDEIVYSKDVEDDING